MPIDKPEATAATNTRRTFLARAAMGSALAATAGSLLDLRPAGAQGAGAGNGLDDDTYLVMADQLHAAAAIVYVAATETAGLDDRAGEALSTFRDHHQQIVTDLGKLMGSTASAADTVPDPTVLAARDGLGGDQGAVLRSLVRLEEQLAATHLQAIGALDDAVTARAASEVLATSHQRAAYLARVAGEDPASLLPATVDDADALTAARAAAEATLAGETPADAEPSTDGDTGDEDEAASDAPSDAAGGSTDGEDAGQNDDTAPEAGN